MVNKRGVYSTLILLMRYVFGRFNLRWLIVVVAPQKPDLISQERYVFASTLLEVLGKFRDHIRIKLCRSGKKVRRNRCLCNLWRHIYQVLPKSALFEGLLRYAYMELYDAKRKDAARDIFSPSSQIYDGQFKLRKRKIYSN